MVNQNTGRNAIITIHLTTHFSDDKEGHHLLATANMWDPAASPWNASSLPFQGEGCSEMQLGSKASHASATSLLGCRRDLFCTQWTYEGSNESIPPPALISSKAKERREREGERERSVRDVFQFKAFTFLVDMFQKAKVQPSCLLRRK